MAGIQSFVKVSLTVITTQLQYKDSALPYAAKYNLRNRRLFRLSCILYCFILRNSVLTHQYLIVDTTLIS
jgi:hypothetical protein